ADADADNLANGLVRKARWHNATRRLWTGRPSADPGLCDCWDGRKDAKGSYSDRKEDGAIRKHFSLHPALPSHRLISAVEATLLVRVGEAHETLAEARGERCIRIRRLSTTTALHYP